MMNHETTKALAQERQHELIHSAVVARLARRVRRTRHQNGQLPDSDSDAYVELPVHVPTDHVLAA